jgi:hypothetical protein
MERAQAGRTTGVSPQRIFLFACVGIQVAVVLAVLFVPFGFDHRSSWGLDFDDFVFVMSISVLSLLAGLATAGTMRKPGWIAVQVVLAVTLVAAIFKNH